jgi:hypothetical protein
MLLNHPWPPDLHPAEAGFKTRTETILRRAGYWDDPTRLGSESGCSVYLGGVTHLSGTLSDMSPERLT